MRVASLPRGRTLLTPAFGPARRAVDDPDDDQRRLGREPCRQRRELLRVGIVTVRITGAAYAPTPRGDEVVVFTEHFARVFGLPASTIFRLFLTHFGLQPHHLSANVILKLVAFVSLFEAYLVIETCMDL
ncbi:hypothetical protein D1007_57416 [Hordeum vulgare]|nr:hypothetical protein D1007_57416 [Hordeum vulgare]